MSKTRGTAITRFFNEVFKDYTILIIQRPILISVLVIAFTLILTYFAKDVKFDSDIRNFFPSGSAQVLFLEKHQELFDSDETRFFILLETTKPLSENNLQIIPLIQSLSQLLNRQKEISGIDSITHTAVMLKQYDDLLVSTLFGSKSKYRGDFTSRLAMVKRSLLTRHLISKDGKLLVIAGRMPPKYRQVKLLEPIAKKIEKLVDQQILAFQQGSPLEVKRYFAGIPFIRVAALKSIKYDLRNLTPIALVMIAFFLFGQFRKKQALFLPLTAILFSISATLGIIGLLGATLNPLTSIFPILLMVIGVADAVHFLGRYHQERRHGRDYRLAVIKSGKKIIPACLLTSFTTAIGFSSLLFAKMDVLHQFGTIVAIGVLISFLMICTILPVGLYFSKSGAAKAPIKINRYILLFVRAIIKPSTAKLILILGVISSLIGLYFCQQVEINNYTTKLLSAQNPVSLGNDLVEEKLAGLVSFEVNLAGKEGDFQDPDILAKIARAEELLLNKYGMKSSVSLAGIVAELNHQFAGYHKIPEAKNAIAQLLLFFESGGGSMLSRFVSHDFSQARILATCQDVGGKKLLEIKRAFLGDLDSIFAPTNILAGVTGSPVVVASSLATLANELILGLFVALLVITVTIGVVFKSYRIALVSILANILPLILCLGGFGLFNIYLDPAPAVIFTIALGIAVDDTIHLISRYLEELNRGYACYEAIERATAHTITSVLNTSIVLVAGFSIFIFSSFPANNTFGLLGSIIILVALMADLLFTPVMLSLLKPGTKH